MDNKTFQYLLSEFKRIAEDPEETPERRLTAKRAYKKATEGSGPMQAVSVSGKDSTIVADNDLG